MTAQAKLTIRNLRARPVNVPMARPLQTSGGSVATAPLILIDIETEEGVTGCSYVFCYTPLALGPVTQLLVSLGAAIKGDPVAPLVVQEKLQKIFRLLGPQGLTGIAMAGIDMALWDALAKANGLPLVRLLGGEPQPIPAYNSCGLGIIGPERAASEAQELAAPGFKAIKVRIGYPELKTDIEVVRAVKAALGDDILLMSDFNQSLTAAEALRRTRALDDEGLYWIEEPVLASDYAGHAQVRQGSRTAIQTGENWWGPHDMAKSLAAGASDFVMPDVEKIGGVSGWLQAAALANAAGTPMSCHLFPEISAHLLAVTPTRHWLEYVDWAKPILQEPIEIRDGKAIIRETPGCGISWDEDRVGQFLIV